MLANTTNINAMSTPSTVKIRRSTTITSRLSSSSVSSLSSLVHEQRERVNGGYSQTYRNHQIARTSINLSSSAATNSTVKSHKTDAPMLNYIFDSHLASNKHHHHDR